MFKIMLCCSAGMSTSLLVRKMVDVAKERNLPVQIDAYGVSEFDMQFPQYRGASRPAGEIHVENVVRKSRLPEYSGPAH